LRKWNGLALPNNIHLKDNGNIQDEPSAHKIDAFKIR
jgi:hypothetical protein